MLNPGFGWLAHAAESKKQHATDQASDHLTSIASTLLLGIFQNQIGYKIESYLRLSYKG